MKGREKEFIDRLTKLKASPDEDIWRNEINSIVFGDRDFMLEQLGTADAYVSSIIKKAKNKANSRTSFQDALRVLVDEWKPSLYHYDYYYINSFLQLLRAFTPSKGASKLIELARQIQDEDNYASITSYEVTKLYIESIFALFEYFPSGLSLKQNVREYPMFLTYISILRKAAWKKHEISAFVISRLIDHEALDKIESDLVSHIKKNTIILQLLVSIMLEKIEQDRSISQYNSLINELTAEGNEFISALTEQKAVIVDRKKHGLVVVYKNFFSDPLKLGTQSILNRLHGINEQIYQDKTKQGLIKRKVHLFRKSFEN